jgi:hypothetical protein
LSIEGSQESKKRSREEFEAENENGDHDEEIKVEENVIVRRPPIQFGSQSEGPVSRQELIDEV